MPYANICKRPGVLLDPGDQSPEEAQREVDTVPGIRLQWSRHAEVVQVAVQPMTWGSDGKQAVPMVNPDDRRTDAALWSSLGRYEINELIKKLREARDQTFGRDE